MGQRLMDRQPLVGFTTYTLSDMTEEELEVMLEVQNAPSEQTYQPLFCYDYYEHRYSGLFEEE